MDPRRYRGGGSGGPTLVVINDSGTMDNKDITVVSDNGLYSQTKPMESSNYIVFELPWLGTYYIKWTVNGVEQTQTAVVDTVGGVTSTISVPKITVINKNRSMDNKQFTVTNANNSSETYTLTMPAANSMNVELKDLGTYNISWSDSYLDLTQTETVVVNSKTGTTFEISTAPLIIINKDRTMDNRQFVVSLSSDSTKSYTFTMGESNSMSIPLVKFDSYTISWDNNGATRTEIIAISDYSGATATIEYQVNIYGFSIATDAQMSSMLSMHYNNEIDISDFWAVGDTRTIALSKLATTCSATTYTYENHNAESVELVITDFNHDDLVTSINSHSKAAVSVALKNGLKYGGLIHTREPSNTDYKWESTLRYIWMDNIFYYSIPSSFRNSIKKVKKDTIAWSSYSYKVKSYDCYCWLPSRTELYGYATTSSLYEGTQYEYYKISANRVKRTTGASYGWTRSSYGSKSGYYYYYSISYDGSDTSSLRENELSLAPEFAL